MTEPDVPLPGQRSGAISRLTETARVLLALIEDTGPLVAGGKIVTGPAAGEPVPDRALRLKAAEMLTEVNRRLAALLPPPVPAEERLRRHFTLEEIQRELERTKEELARRTPWKITPEMLERARLCVHAAGLRTKGTSYADIARELGFGSPQEAKRVAEAGYRMVPKPEGEAPVPGAAGDRAPVSAAARADCVTCRTCDIAWGPRTEVVRKITVGDADRGVCPHCGGDLRAGLAIGAWGSLMPPHGPANGEDDDQNSCSRHGT